jgi:hypothetical protein
MKLVECPFSNVACEYDCSCGKPHTHYRATPYTDFCDNEERYCRLFGAYIKCVPVKERENV